MPENIVFVHGYSVRSLDAYGQVPRLLATLSQSGQNFEIFLSAFDSLDDEITCIELAKALELRISRLEAQNKLSVKNAAFVCHSTGAIVTRRWILDRIASKKDIPSHFVSMAGANHGSTLAQLGRTQWAQFGKQVFDRSPSGQGVLTDLDYGSRFLLDLNREWLKQENNGFLSKTFCFSMVGDDNTANEKMFGGAGAVFWQVREIGSDSTVRISGSNLNYRMLTFDGGSTSPQLEVLQLKSKVAHKILPGVAHTGEETGIFDSIKSLDDKPLKELITALAVKSPQEYKDLSDRWDNENNDWQSIQANLSIDQSKCKSTIVFEARLPFDKPVDDYVITILDENSRAKTVSSSIMKNQPIQNNTNRSAVSFYVDYKTFSGAHPHILNLEIDRSPEKIQYDPVNYKVPQVIEGLIMANEFTYVAITLDEAVFHVLNYAGSLDLKAQWPPLPKEQWWVE
ncbi:MAG: hypothetical protein P4L53_06750 [Candidatus Obscuribacterales bacterium]|nr:hypothetical protein [Candidatus Obscuribacterales bacterium]